MYNRFVSKWALGGGLWQKPKLASVNVCVVLF